jgi:DNA polymerase I-like protein with 3'-5' exonuclease and polymerase domains
MVVVIDDVTPATDMGRFESSINGVIDGSGAIAFDVEGVNLSRVGTIELVSLALNTGTEQLVFLLDIGAKCIASKRLERIGILKRLFEAENVVKIIHDCRMDCDAMVHTLGICLKNVHDTSCYHAVITGKSDVNLNDTLFHYGIGANTSRDKSIYNSKPRFWATRPLITHMKEWATSDVDKLARVAEIQKQRLNSSELARAKQESASYTTIVSSMKLERNVRLGRGKSVGTFIGPGGSNIRNLQKRTGTMIYKDFEYGDLVWMVFYPNDVALQSVKRAMGH